MAFEYLLTDSQTQTGADDIAFDLGIAVISVEHLGEKFLGDALSVIGNFYAHSFLGIYLLDAYDLVIAGIIDGVVDEVIYHLIEFIGVCIDLSVLIGFVLHIVADLFYHQLISCHTIVYLINNGELASVQLHISAFKL